MGLPRIDTLKAQFHFKLSYYEDYLTSIEKFIDNETAALSEHFQLAVEQAKGDAHFQTDLRELLSQGVRASEEELIYPGFEEEFQRLDYYPNILRRSLFVAIFSDLLLATMFAICRREAEKGDFFGEPFDNFFKGQKRNGKSDIEALGNYLEQEIGITVSSYEEWTEFLHFNDLRNCIVHDEGRLRKSRKKNELISYVEASKPLLTWREDLAYMDDIRWFEISPSYDWIVLEKGYCEKVLQDIRTFFRQLLPTG